MIERPQRLAVASAGDADDSRGGGARRQDPVRAEQHLLNLADAIGALLPARAQCEPAGEADGPRVIYDIRHVTTYAYDSPVTFAPLLAAAGAAQRRRQQLLSHARRDPAAAGRTHGRARFFRQPVTESVLIETAHRNLRINSRSRVSVSRTAAGPPAQSPAWEDVRDAAFSSSVSAPLRRSATSLRARWCRVPAPLTAYAAGELPAGRRHPRGRRRPDVADPPRFHLRPQGDRGLDAAREAFEQRHGVCQDFAHIMIAGPARPRPAGGLCQRLSPHHSAAGPAAPGGRGRQPRLGLGLVRRGARLDRLRPDQRHPRRERPHRPGDRPRLRRRLPDRRHHRRLAQAETRPSPWTCCWWSDDWL